MVAVCGLFGLSRAAYYAARKRRERGPSSVTRLARRPCWASTAEVLCAIREVVAEHQAWGVRKVWATLRREHDLRGGRKRVWALMRSEGLLFERTREPAPSLRGHVTTAEPNRRLATDLTTIWTRRDGWVAVTPTIDCGCRSLLGLVVSKDQDALTVLASLRQAVTEAFGRPSAVPEAMELLSDHGAQFTGAECEAMCEHWNLTHIFSRKGRPTGNAVAERVIRTIKEEVLWLRDWETADQVRDALEAWVPVYNERRPHQALDYQAPAEVRREHLGYAQAA